MIDFGCVREPFWGPFWDQNRIQKSIKKVIRFLIDFGRVLVPKIAAFWTNFGSQINQKSRSKKDRFLENRGCRVGGKGGGPLEGIIQCSMTLSMTSACFLLSYLGHSSDALFPRGAAGSTTFAATTGRAHRQWQWQWQCNAMQCNAMLCNVM